MAKPSGSRYRVVYSERHRQAIHAGGIKAAQLGLGSAYLAAIKSIDHRLKTDPLGWGDPQNRLRHLRLTVYHGMRTPLHAYYAVDEKRRIVYVQEISPLPDQGMD